MQQLLQAISAKAFLTPDLMRQIEVYFEPVHHKKGDRILSERRRAGHLYFIDKGLLHTYYFHEEKQVSSWFYQEGYFITAWGSFYNQNPSFEEIECLEDCDLFRISYTNYQKLVADFPAFGNFGRLLAEEMLAFLDEFFKGWAFLSAKDKYRMLLDYFPDVGQRVKLGLIASFLGISQETLSRVRARR